MWEESRDPRGPGLTDRFCHTAQYGNGQQSGNYGGPPTAQSPAGYGGQAPMGYGGQHGGGGSGGGGNGGGYGHGGRGQMPPQQSLQQRSQVPPSQGFDNSNSFNGY